jgi:hypothetical protein
MKRNIIIMGIVLGLMVLLTAQSSLAWSINPAKWILYHRDDFEIEVYEFPIEIKNDDDTPIAVKLSIIKPEYLYDGNTEFPNLEWITIDGAQLNVAPNSEERATIKIDVGNHTEAYNQSWEFWIHATQTEGSGNIRTNYNCRWTLQTPMNYVPLEERPGFVDWGNIAIMFGVIGGSFVIFLILYKKGIFSKKPKPELAKSEKPVSMREQKQKREPVKPKETKQEQKKNSNVIKYKKG